MRDRGFILIHTFNLLQTEIPLLRGNKHYYEHNKYNIAKCFNKYKQNNKSGYILQHKSGEKGTEKNINILKDIDFDRNYFL